MTPLEPGCHCERGKRRITLLCLECGWKEEQELPPPIQEELATRWASIEREEQMETPPASDLEPVRQLIHEAGIQPMTGAGALSVCLAAQTAIPALKSLLDEAEYLHSDAMKLHLKELNEDLATAQRERAMLQEECSNLIAMGALIQTRLQSPGSPPPPPGGIMQWAEGTVNTTVARIAHLQEKCEKIPGLRAEAEAHRALLIDRDETIHCLRESLQELVEALVATLERDEG